MAEKVKINFSELPDAGEEKIHIAGIDVTVKHHIPIEEKNQMARDLIDATTFIDDEMKIVQKSYMEDVSALYLIIMYYTNIDLIDVVPTMLYDWMTYHPDIWDQIRHIVNEDYKIVYRMYCVLKHGITQRYDKENSLSTAVMKTFGFMLNGEDITETLAKSSEISDKMIDVVGQLQELKSNQDAGKVKVGGNVINIGKKQN